MRTLRERWALSRATLAMLVVAALLLGAGGVSGTRAALTAFSGTYDVRMATSNIGVALLENGEPVAWRTYASEGAWDEASGTLLAALVPEGESVHMGERYAEELRVQNTGTVGQYVRVTLRRYWTDAEGVKQQDVWPGLIELHLVSDGPWVVDEGAATEERIVLYCTELLEPGDVSAPFVDGLTIDGQAGAKVTETAEVVDGVTVITTSYDYDGLRFNVEAQVDAIQQHNADDAALSAWGRSLELDGSTLRVS